jgi:hypothetical protein
MENFDKFIPNDKEIINELYQDREVVPVGNLEDFLKLPLNEGYANNKLRVPTTYKFTEVKESKELQKELGINISTNDIIKK